MNTTKAPVTSIAVFKALMLRDVIVLRRNLKEFIPRAVLQPLLLIFVFTYVFPKIGQSVGGSDRAEAFSTVLAAGVLASVIFFQGLQAVALPLVQELGYTKQIEDQAMAPLRIELLAFQKIVSGALQCLLAVLLVIPLAIYVPATRVELDISWPLLLLVTLLACMMSSALGLVIGTVFEPQAVPSLFGIVLIPITFLGCIHYPWPDLESIRWLQVLVLVNPLVYMSEAFRAALTPVPHLAVGASCLVMGVFSVMFGWVGVRGFVSRILS